MPDPNTCGNEYAALTGSPYAPRFKEQAYVAEINQLLARVAELEIQNLGLSEQAIKDRREAGELRARVAELEAQVAEIPDLLLIAHMQGAEQAKDQIQALRAQVLAALKNNGGPVDPSDTIDSINYVMVRQEDFDALELALKQ